jgi:hypothetical protein
METASLFYVRWPFRSAVRIRRDGTRSTYRPIVATITVKPPAGISEEAKARLADLGRDHFKMLVGFVGQMSSGGLPWLTSEIVYWAWRRIASDPVGRLTWRQKARPLLFGPRFLSSRELEFILALTARPDLNVRPQIAMLSCEEDFVGFYRTIFMAYRSFHSKFGSLAHVSWASYDLTASRRGVSVARTKLRDAEACKH